MATLILTAVGNLVGGPIGGAIAAIIGQQIDQEIFKPAGRQGPRLNDLSAQSSRYGAKIPKLFGTVRAAGTVIWSTDLIESASTSGGKGQPNVTTYSYSASFAVLISARPIRDIGRIWADGNLLRGTAGDWKVPTQFRLYHGDADQPLDPLIASAEGVAQTPAYRGGAYAVFENIVLDSFGRRVPSLTFEVFADDGAVTLADVITGLSGPGVTADARTSFGGYAASGDSIRGAIETLTAVAPIRVYDTNDMLTVRDTPGAQWALSDNDLGAVDSSTPPVPRLALARQSSSTVPETMVLSYYDSARDYQQSAQRARRLGGARKEELLDLPATLDASSAKTLVENTMSTRWAARVTAKAQLGWRHAAIVPGDTLTTAAGSDVWRVSAMRLNKMVLECDLVRQAYQLDPNTVTGDPGRLLAPVDRPAGATHLALLDLPPLSDGALTRPTVGLAAAGDGGGWASAALSESLDGGASWASIGTTVAAAIMGTAQSILGTGPTAIVDQLNTVDVALLNTAMTLADADEPSLLAGANLAMLGAELLQFAHAAPLGGVLWRLSGLWRGRRGTEDAVTTHTAGEPFTLVTRATIATLVPPLGTAQLSVMAQGVGDPQPVLATLATPSRAVQPLSPVGLAAARAASGDISLTWTRRSRDGWQWLDLVDAPLVEESEQYRVTCTTDLGAVTDTLVTSASYVLTQAAQAAYRAAGARMLSIAVRQRGTYAESYAATLPLNL